MDSLSTFIGHVTMHIYQEILGRFISRIEALRIAREILEQAERERILIAEYEAARGIQWENGDVTTAREKKSASSCAMVLFVR